MPLPEEVMRQMKERLDSVKERMKSIEDVIADLRASGIDASRREEELAQLRETLRKWETFYDLQSKRRPTE